VLPATFDRGAIQGIGTGADGRDGIGGRRIGGGMACSWHRNQRVGEDDLR
jgi:hypothetical protein